MNLILKAQNFTTISLLITSNSLSSAKICLKVKIYQIKWLKFLKVLTISIEDCLFY